MAETHIPLVLDYYEATAPSLIRALIRTRHVFPQPLVVRARPSQSDIPPGLGVFANPAERSLRLCLIEFRANRNLSRDFCSGRPLIGCLAEREISPADSDLAFPNSRQFEGNFSRRASNSRL